jgi:hypothetical protein
MTESKRGFYFKETATSPANNGVAVMRLFFMRAGHIPSVEELPGLSDEEATAKAHALFSERKRLYEGLRVVGSHARAYQHPTRFAQYNAAVWPLHRVATAAAQKPPTAAYRP